MDANKKLDIGMYTIDKEYRILYRNQAVKDMYPDVEPGCLCYKSIALRDEPCAACPLREKSVLFYNAIRKQWISATAANIEVPGLGACYNVQYELRSEDSGKRSDLAAEDVVLDHLSELQSGEEEACIIGAYYEPGSPLFYINGPLIALLGYEDVDDVIRHTNGMVANLVHPDDRIRVRQDMVNLHGPGATFETAYRTPCKDGSWIWVVTRGRCIETPDGKLATLGVCADMSDFLKRHETLREENQNLLRREMLSETSLQSMPSGYHRCAMDDRFTFLYFGKSFEDVVGWTREEIERDFHNSFAELVLPEDLPLCAGIIKAIAEKGSSNAIYRIKQRDGRDRWFSDSTMRVDLGDDSFYQGTLTDVTDFVENINAQKRELEIARAQAEASSQAKSAFLFNLSHDIRTPMNAIQGFAHIIEQNPGNEALVQDVIAKVRKSGDILMKLLNDVLEISRIESGKEQIDLAVTDLGGVVDRMRLMFAQEIKDAGITFSMVNSVCDTSVWCDELKLVQIGMNMLSNAKKFTPPGGKIVFGIEQLDKSEDTATYRFYVQDTGIGMSKEFQSRAFDQFERERTSTNSGVVGSGLGLSIIKRLADLMGGTCTLESEPGAGTEIAVILKLQLADQVEVPQMPDMDRAKELQGKHVLLAEDNDFNREIARYILENLGMRVTEAEDGAMAVNKLQTAPAGTYDLVLMDIQMPAMDGYTATREIRRFEDARIAATPIIAMTANAFKEDKERCLEVGMNGHIGKPIDIKDIIKVLLQVL